MRQILILTVIVGLFFTAICFAPIYKNVASQKVFIFAYDKTTGLGKTGDAANITAYISSSGHGTVSNDANPTEIDDTNMPGIYAFDLTQGETNQNQFILYAKSITSNILIEPAIIITQASISPYTWHVSKLGSNANDGHSQEQAKLTIGDAVTAAANGDTIIIWPGIYDEAIDSSNKTSISFVGTNRYKCKISKTSGYDTVLKIGNNTSIKNLTIQSALYIACGTSALGKSNLTFEDCNFVGAYDGLNLYGASNVSIKNCFISGTYDGANFGSVDNLLCEKTTFVTDGSYGTTGLIYQAVHFGGASVINRAIFKDCIFIGARNVTTAGGIGGLSVNAGPSISQVVCENCIFSGQGGSGVSGAVFGAQVSLNGLLTINNCSFNTSGSGSVVADLIQSSTGKIEIANSTYTTSSGTITQGGSGWAEGINAEVDTTLTDYAPAKASELAETEVNAAITKGYALDAKTAAEKIDSALELRTFIFGGNYEGATEPNQTTTATNVSTLTTRLPQTLQMVQIGGTGVYYVKAVDPNGSPVEYHRAITATVSSGDMIAIAKKVGEDPNVAKSATALSSTTLSNLTNARVLKLDHLDMDISDVNGGAGAVYARDTTVAEANSTTQFNITDGKNADDAYIGQIISVQDANDDNIEVRYILDYVGATKTVIVNLPFTFTPTVGDVVHILETSYIRNPYKEWPYGS